MHNIARAIKKLEKLLDTPNRELCARRMRMEGLARLIIPSEDARYLSITGEELPAGRRKPGKPARVLRPMTLADQKRLEAQFNTRILRIPQYDPRYHTEDGKRRTADNPYVAERDDPDVAAVIASYAKEHHRGR